MALKHDTLKYEGVSNETLSAIFLGEGVDDGKNITG
jgi:hypothetical protein